MSPKFKTFLCLERCCQENEKATPKWEKIFAKHLSDKGLTFRCLKKSQSSITRKRTVQFKWAKYLNSHFTKEDIHIAVKSKRCLTLFIIREKRIQTTMKSHCRWHGENEKDQRYRVWCGFGGTKALIHCW